MSDINTDDDYSSSTGDDYTENTTYRSLLTLNGRTLFYVNSWYKYTPGIVTWVTLGHNTLINIGGFTEIVFPSSIYFNMGISTSWSGKVNSLTFTYQQAAIKKLSAKLLTFNAKAQRKLAVVSGIESYLSKVDSLSNQTRLIGLSYENAVNKVNRASIVTKALALNLQQEQASINNGLFQARVAVNSNRKAMNKVKNIKSSLSNSVCRVNSGNVSIKDDVITVHA
ncbi:hypothetical protein [Shewanella surugensis]|uniref:DUF1983 domain-containing protein n=1 Tax=Shewanella surugensis TaxID=212020 RepID=A0ABT0L7D1_9GAMM|nr:hypothetical protein [Shewanella surugensis]MCL1123474.1 hypothetical protein [Shewanella surugensis]